MPKTTAERQRDYRARKAAQGLEEIRGLFANPADHPKIRAYVERLKKSRAKC